jgi:hypothetical protein
MKVSRSQVRLQQLDRKQQMTTRKNFKLSMAAIAASLLVAACGGGGGGDNSTGTTPAQSSNTPSSGIAPQTSVPAPTYAAGSFQASAFAQINAYRSAMGVGMFAQETNLYTSAQAHASYLFVNLKSKALTALSHDENSSLPGYYADTALSRAQKAGSPATEWIGEVAAAGLAQSTSDAAASDCVGQFLASVYHLNALTFSQEKIGLGFMPGDSTYPIYTCVFDLGTITGVQGAAPAPGDSYPGGQQIATDAIVHSPYSNEQNVATAMRAESPNPAADVASPGRPILVRVNSEGANTLTVSQFTMTDSGGNAVSSRILVPSSAQAGSSAQTTADPNNLLSKGSAVLLPLSPLKASTTYTVTFTGARDGKSMAATWSFTTKAN